MTELELHRAPGSTSIVELHLERLHDVCRGHCRRPRRSLPHKPTREAGPSTRQRLFELGAEHRKGSDPRGIEIPSESRAPPLSECHRTATLDRSGGQHLADDDQPHAHPAPLRQPFITFEISNALFQRTHAGRRTHVAQEAISLRTRRHSAVVNSPSFRACLAAPRRLSISIRR
ncbi:hypothetical protein JOE54_001521 [Brachybacterium tyrofermentans]